MGLLDQVLSAVAQANKVVSQFDRARSQYDPGSKAGSVLQHVENRIASLVPTLAPSVVFSPLGGLGVSLLISNAGRWRQFTVEAFNQNAAPVGRQATKIPYQIRLSVEIGYPPDPNVSVTDAAGVTTVYRTADLKVADTEQIDHLLRADGELATAPAVSGATPVSFESSFDLGNTVRRSSWIIYAERAW